MNKRTVQGLTLVLLAVLVGVMDLRGRANLGLAHAGGGPAAAGRGRRDPQRHARPAGRRLVERRRGWGSPPATGRAASLGHRRTRGERDPRRCRRRAGLGRGHGERPVTRSGSPPPPTSIRTIPAASRRSSPRHDLHRRRRGDQPGQPLLRRARLTPAALPRLAQDARASSPLRRALAGVTGSIARASTV